MSESSQDVRGVGPIAWLLLVAGENREHGGNDGYVDDPDARYSWDSTVMNHGRVAIGDHIALWDKQQLIGASVVEAIMEDDDDKLLRKCKHCGKADIKARKTKLPKYRCFSCGGTFDDPIVQIQRVRTYRTKHDAGWHYLEGLLTGTELRQLCYSPKSQLSMRRLDWQRFVDALASRGIESLGRLSARSQPLLGGHRQTTVRVRVGQAAFRDRLLREFGPVCAITGSAPAEALEGAHLYSYAKTGVHHEDGGLLLRRDIHRLFDEGLICVDPETLMIDIHPDLVHHQQYADLKGRPLSVKLNGGHIRWLSAHWAKHWI